MARVPNVKYHKLLRERCGGAFEGTYKCVIKRKCPKFFRKRAFRAPGAESSMDVFNRVNVFLQKLISAHLRMKSVEGMHQADAKATRQRILIVSHKAWIYYFLDGLNAYLTSKKVRF